ncbi:hypothetical protein SNL152K_32 [Streptomyces sp. NL15-2K]|nr:hypothetical protein SNL152K_32 [Streptomyces sp. NL15-2K]
MTMGAYGTASLVTRRVPAPMRRVRPLESALAVRRCRGQGRHVAR